MQHGTTEVFEHDLMLQEVLLDLLDVRRRQIDLVDGDDDGHTRTLGVRDGFNGLRHDLVVGRDHDDDDVRDLRTTCTHGREGLVTRRIEEGDGALARHLHVVGTDVLRNATRFTATTLALRM
jgi:hypothetical protein